jgi:hypothetical protein
MSEIRESDAIEVHCPHCTRRFLVRDSTFYDTIQTAVFMGDHPTREQADAKRAGLEALRELYQAIERAKRELASTDDRFARNALVILETT